MVYFRFWPRPPFQNSSSLVMYLEVFVFFLSIPNKLIFEVKMVYFRFWPKPHFQNSSQVINFWFLSFSYLSYFLNDDHLVLYTSHLLVLVVEVSKPREKGKRKIDVRHAKLSISSRSPSPSIHRCRRLRPLHIPSFCCSFQPGMHALLPRSLPFVYLVLLLMFHFMVLNFQHTNFHHYSTKSCNLLLFPFVW